MSRWFRVTAATLRLGAGLTLAALAVRLAQSSVERSIRVLDAQELAARAKATSEKGNRSEPRLILPLPLSATAPLPADLQKVGAASEPTGSRAKAQGVPPGSAIRMPVSVLLGPERSEVYVDRQKKGLTPFIGEIACKAGDPVRVDVVPPRGMPLSFERTCERRTLRLQ